MPCPGTKVTSQGRKVSSLPYTNIVSFATVVKDRNIEKVVQGMLPMEEKKLDPFLSTASFPKNQR